MANEIISRIDAQRQGLKRYFTGAPCSKGHIVERLVCDCSCKQCAKEKIQLRRRADPSLARQKDRNWRKANPEKSRARYKRYHLRHPDKVKAANVVGSAKQRALRKQKAAEEGRIIWQHVSVEERKKHSREQARKRYHAKTLEKKRSDRARYKWEGAKEYLLRWARNNPERVIAKTAKRRSAKLKSEGSFTRDDLAWIMKAQNGKCAYCRLGLSKRKKHVDHIIPLSCGGSNDRTNIQYLCAPCNLTKGAKDPILFAQELGRLL